MALAILIGLAACQAPTSPGVSTEPGFTAFCKANPGKGTCP
jgi:hypothetical protein